MGPALIHQRELLESWLQTPAALAVARRFVHRRRLNRSPEELLSETWLRLGRTLANRSEPYPDMETADAARRYLSRVMDNLSRDMARSIARRNELELLHDIAGMGAEELRVEGQMVLLELVRALDRRAEQGLEFPGCRTDLVVRTATEVLHLLLVDHDGGDHGQTSTDRLVYEALDRASDRRPMSPEARRQRKARYAPAVLALLEETVLDLGLHR